MSRTTVLMASAALLLAVAIMMVKSFALPPAVESVWMFAAVDRSQSNQSELGLGAFYIAGGAAQLRGEDLLTAYRLDYDCREIWGAPPPPSIERFKHDLADALRPGPSRPGTRPALFFKAVADRLAADSEARVSGIVLLLSDGDDDDQSLHSLYVASLKRIAKDARVRMVACVGVADQNREQVRQRFSVLPPARFQLRGTADFDTLTLNRWIASVRSAHSEGSSSK